MAVATLGEVRHACHACGASCAGGAVWVQAHERAALVARARELGVADPMDGEVLRRKDGACVFLAADRRCRLHATFGYDAKPAVCRQYPLIVVRTESGARAGVDPGCFSAWRTTEASPLVESAAAIAGKSELAPAERAAEADVVRLLGPGQTIGGALAALVGEPPGPTSAGGLPVAFGARLQARLAAAPLRARLALPAAGWALRGALAPVADRCARLADEPPGAWALPPALDAFAVDAVRRLVWLRLAPLVPAPAAALLALSGAVACAWTDPTPARFGPALAAWTRGLRHGDFVLDLAPDPEALRALVGR